MGFASFHQWFSGKLSIIAAYINALTKIPTCHCWTLQAPQAFIEHKWSFTQAKEVIIWSHIAVDVHFQ